jgi:hypothetical protein
MIKGLLGKLQPLGFFLQKVCASEGSQQMRIAISQVRHPNTAREDVVQTTFYFEPGFSSFRLRSCDSGIANRRLGTHVYPADVFILPASPTNRKSQAWHPIGPRSSLVWVFEPGGFVSYPATQESQIAGLAPNRTSHEVSSPILRLRNRKSQAWHPGFLHMF